MYIIFKITTYYTVSPSQINKSGFRSTMFAQAGCGLSCLLHEPNTILCNLLSLLNSLVVATSLWAWMQIAAHNNSAIYTPRMVFVARNLWFINLLILVNGDVILLVSGNKHSLQGRVTILLF